ncbi:peptidase domain-containing ABC transporter [Paracraurococcus lichenis]|uniref:ATP-binding cassette domain-containing protein n=1 Tax=Paracraurococcus lichenis TaxID=3064888 RepID=A0ABT9E9Z1_9PROT|nr:ATP-binding cassette domain-containing protein [Paracraurococcus sp. LOR1-02]MDO9713019.1 ATP-binding cassette domain-containing protein [Paracraurococcus sp. LOR1-02]
MNAFSQSLPTASDGVATASDPGVLLLHPPGIQDTDLTRCLAAFLVALRWDGGMDDLLGALPHAEPRPDLTDIRNALAGLGYPTRPMRLRRGRLDARLLPALLIRRDHPAAVLYHDVNGTALLFDGGTGETRACIPEGLSGRLYLTMAPAAPNPRESWLGALARRFIPNAPVLLGISALVTVFGLTMPIFTMLVFDLVVTSHRPEVLTLLVPGAVTGLLGEIGFRALRQRALARIGERLDRLVSSAVFGQIMVLPAALVERAGTAAQISRLRDFAAIRDVLTGSFALALLDLPFTLLVLGLLLVLGGWIALVPILSAFAFILLFLASRGAVRRAINTASQAGQARDVLGIELLDAHRSLKLAGAEGRWAEAYAAAAARAALASARAAALSSRVTATAQVIVTLSGLSAMTLGVIAVLAGGMSAGALIAGMMLIWRVLAPMQTAFLMLSRWEQTRASIRQVDGMMSLEGERPAATRRRLAAPEHGDIVFQRVSLRYLPTAEPVLAGASFAIRHGELIAVTGSGGSGKSTLLRLVAGLYRPQSGVVRIGGHDVRAFDPTVLRRAVAYVPQSPDLLYGTIAQNLRLGLPSASDEDLHRACAEAHVLQAVEALPEGMATRLGDNATAGLPRSVLVRLCLARALLRNAPVLLLDEPVAGLDDDCAEAFAAVIASRRGRSTILMTTHRPSHVRLADRVLRIADGLVEEVPPAVAGRAASAAPPLLRMPVFQPPGRPT